MMPGMGGRMDPRRMNKMMKQLGIDVDELEGVEEVLIRTADREYRFDKPSVTVMKAQGQTTYQVVGEPEVAGLSVAEQAAKAGVQEEAPKGPSFSEEDVTMVAEQTGASQARAKKALEETGGDIAEAILKLSET